VIVEHGYASMVTPPTGCIVLGGWAQIPGKRWSPCVGFLSLERKNKSRTSMFMVILRLSLLVF